MGGAAVLVVEVVGVLPDVESKERMQAVGHRVVGAGVLRDRQLSGGICLEPDPAASEEADAFGFELGLEGVEGAPLLLDLLFEIPGQAGNDGRVVTPDATLGYDRGLIGGLELREVEVVVQDLAGVVKYGALIPGQIRE